ncbi:hypothetical protein [Corynebacterium camporealensis]
MSINRSTTQTLPLFAVFEETSVKNSGMVESNLLSLSYGKIVPKSIATVGGLLPASFETYQIVTPGQIVLRLTDMQNDQKSLRSGLVREKGIISSAYCALRTRGWSSSWNRYFDYYFHALDVSKRLYSLGGGVRQSLKYADIKHVQIPIPAETTRDRIVQFLDEETAKIDHLITKQRELLDLTTSWLQVWRENAFWGGATTDPFLNPPEGWEVLRNCHILEHVDGRSDTGEEELLSVSHITGVTPRSMKNVTMFEAESTVGYRLVEKDELVINTMCAWLGALGVSQYKGVVSPSYDVYRFRDPVAANPMYFDCMYRTAAYVSLMKANSRGIWESRLRLYPEVFLRLTSLVPPKDLQDQLVSENRERTAEAERLVDRGNQAIQLLQERRSALITAAVTGQIEV